MPTIEKESKATIIKKRPAEHMHMPAPSALEVPQSPYTQEEAVVVGRIKALLGGNVENIAVSADEKKFNILPSEPVVARRKAIIHEIDALVSSILADRGKEAVAHTPQEFFAYLDLHIDEPDYVFLTAKPVGVNVNGWGIFAGLLHPLDQGLKIGPAEASKRQSNWRSGH